jgi:hypothetical protein
VWEALELTENDMVMLVYTPATMRPTTPAVEPQTVEPQTAEPPTLEKNEMSRIKTEQPLYHLLVLDRAHCEANADISDLQSIKLIYKFSHGKNGYLVAVYASSNEGPVFPVMPDRSRVIVNMITTNLTFLRDYANSSPFKRFVTNRQAIAQLRRALR